MPADKFSWEQTIKAIATAHRHAREMNQPEMEAAIQRMHMWGGIHARSAEKEDPSYAKAAMEALGSHENLIRGIHADMVKYRGTTKKSDNESNDLKKGLLPGTAVEISSKTTPHKFGIVQPNSIHAPHKISVQVGTNDASIILVDPVEVKPRDPSSRIEKALMTVYNIRKALKNAAPRT